MASMIACSSAMIGSLALDAAISGRRFTATKVAFVFFFAVLMIGGESAARRVGVPTYFVLVLVALLGQGKLQLVAALVAAQYADFARTAYGAASAERPPVPQ